MSKEAAQFAAILKSWGPTLHRAVSKANSNRWPSGAPGGKGGQFAPGKGGSAPYSTSNAGFKPKQMSLFNYAPKAPQLDAGKPKQEDYGAFGKPMGSWGSWGSEPAAPKAPPPGAKPHPHLDDKGKPVTINYPTKPSGPETWKNPDATATFTPGSAVPAVLNGVPMKSWADAPTRLHEWANVEGQKPELDRRFPMPEFPGKSIGAGVIIEEPDGRIWLTKPTNHFGGYMQTFPKGTVENGLSLQASAIKETFEETGLKVEITGIAGDYERTTSVARFYLAKRVGGTPADMGWESQAVRLASKRDLNKLLNMQVDKNIIADFHNDEFTKAAPLSLVRNFAEIDEAVARRGLEWLYKAGTKAGGSKGGSWQHQDRWPAGSPLGGQWKAMGADGLTLPPTIAAGLDGKNPAYQKKANAIHAMAQANDFTGVLDQAVMLEKKVLSDKAAGKKSTHVKWNAQVSQYAQQLVQDMAAKPKAEASAAKISGPDKLSDYTKVGEKPGGSNDGAKYADKDGTTWLVKGNNYASTGGMAMSDDRAKNEVLASKLMAAAGIPGPEMKLIDLEGKHQGNLGVAVKWIDGLQKFNKSDAGQLAAVQNQFAVHAWLGNWDVLGMHLDNVMFKDGKAINIDPGGSILFRAQGAPKKEGLFDKGASDWESMRSTDQHQKSVFGSMTASQLQESAKHLANISDDMINKLVDVHGPGDLKAKVALAQTLIARRDAIIAKAGLNNPTVKLGSDTVHAPTPAPAPQPPKVEDAVPAPAGTSLPVEKPKFVGKDGVNKYYDDLVAKADALHASGDLAGLKAMYDPKKVMTWAGTSPNSAIWVPYHTALVNDLEAKQKGEVDKVAQGKATVTDDKGQEWKATNGVLNPVGDAAPAAGTGNKLETSTIMQIADKHGLNTALTDEETKDATELLWYAEAGNVKGLQSYQVYGHAKLEPFKADLLTAMGAPAPAPAAAPAAAPAPKPKKASRGLTDAQIADAAGAAYKFSPAMAAASVADGKKSGSSAFHQMIQAASKGDYDALLSINAPHATADQFKSNLLNALKVQNAVPPAAASEPAPAPAPAAAPAKPLPAMPDFASYYTTSEKNKKSHNAKVDLIASLAKKGDVHGILALGYGSNTYSKQQVELANNVLAALGSPHQVSKQQAENSHPALIGGTAQNVTPPASPAAGPASPAPKIAPVKNGPVADDHSWANLKPGQQIVESGDQFGVKWVKIANPAKGFSPGDIPTPPDFFKNGNQGPDGTWKSSKKDVNEANNLATKQIYDAALQSNGDTTKLEALKFYVVGQGEVSISKHPAAAVKEYFDNVTSELKAQTRVTYETKQSGSFSAAYSDVAASIAALHPTKNYEDFAAHAAKAADYLVLSKDAAANLPVPSMGQFKETSTKNADVKPFLAASKAAYDKLPQEQRNAFVAYTGNAYDNWNEALRKGTVTQYKGAMDMLEGFKKAAQDIPEGTIIWRGIGVGKSVYDSVAGGVIQDGSFQSSSYGAHPGGPGYGKQTWLRIHVAKGVKGIDATNFSIFGSGEREIIIQNNVRYAVLKVEQHQNFKDSNGKSHGKKTIVDVIALPH